MFENGTKGNLVSSRLIRGTEVAEAKETKALTMKHDKDRLLFACVWSYKVQNRDWKKNPLGCITKAASFCTGGSE